MLGGELGGPPAMHGGAPPRRLVPGVLLGAGVLYVAFGVIVLLAMIGWLRSSTRRGVPPWASARPRGVVGLLVLAVTVIFVPKPDRVARTPPPAAPIDGRSVALRRT